MENLSAIANAPIPTILVIGGIFFLLLAVASVKGIKPSPQRQKLSGFFGFGLLAIGIALYLLPSQPPSSSFTPTAEVPIAVQPTATQQITVDDVTSAPPSTSPTVSVSPTATIPPFPGFPLALTPSAPMKNSAVETVQKRLLELGYDELKVADGVYGSLTANAVKNFQAVNNLPVDGVVTQPVWDRLFSDTAKPKPKP